MEKASEKITVITAAVFILLSLGSVIFLYNQNQQLRKLIPTATPIATETPSPISEPTPEPTISASPSSKTIKTPISTVACTMEAKICPDGSSVGREGPNCEFTPCPLP